MLRFAGGDNIQCCDKAFKLRLNVSHRIFHRSLIISGG